ncbi:ABC-type transport auxiliary lipoprotein family protein [Herbaspirillum autotrophicum]|uniref:ABC-type transport auxiliary lipoprotein family protein n=1 Tax=Herbaspirillum autotrophicum TaxID=180195 RepID=UPI00067E623C|nr:ABC-type transport auxiliary lipoprotein family protein [Herbaspirillum autotrophicum]
MSHTYLRTLSAVCALSLTAACSILPTSEPVAIYRLPATPAAARTSTGNAIDGAAGARSLRILTPYGSRAVDSERILVLPQNNLVQSYAGARWSDPAPVLLRNRLLQAFTADGRIRYLSSDDSNVLTDQELGGDLLAFQSEYRNGAPTVNIQFNARLIDSASRRIIAVRSFNVSQPVSGVQTPQVVDAFGQASDVLAADVISWVTALPAAGAKK